MFHFWSLTWTQMKQNLLVMKTSPPSATDKQPYDTEKGNPPDLTDTQILIEEWI